MTNLYMKTDVYAIDADYASVANVPAMQLMETASENACRTIDRLLSADHPSNILIACGGGNNGGDGLAVARMLSTTHNVCVLFDKDLPSASPLTMENFERLPASVRVLPLNSVDDLVGNRYDVVVDALVGVGGSHNLRKETAEICRALNSFNALKVAIDLPTGLDADTGRWSEDTFNADHTITMVGPKPGMYLGGGRSNCGVVHQVAIGHRADIESDHCYGAILDASDVRRILQRRVGETSKFTYGRVGVVGGTKWMPGAPSLTAHSALATGAGLVEMLSPSIHPLTPREIITHVLPCGDDGTVGKDANGALRDLLDRITVLAFGPGIGRSADTLNVLTEMFGVILEGKPGIPVVIDADGLNVVPALPHLRPNIIVTPHVGEFSRLSGITVNDIEAEPLQKASLIAKKMNCVVHLKGAVSVTTNGTRYYLTVNGNAALSKAGSGDVLTGIIAGLLAQGVAPLEAAALGSFLHAECAARYAQNRPLETMMPSDVIDGLSKVIPL
jgi:ADP-dependent NAD(P)H-hydrate dehydratase / NAD(P)H-hydrate epimerase